MYGLMKASICSRHGEETDWHRLHYCGTCKTMGAISGQKSRLMLNHDAVFLSELLTLLSPKQEPVQVWSRAYRSLNCFTLPEAETEMPLSLQIAARSTLVMIEYKVADQRDDTKQGRWQILQRLFSSEFYEASRWLQERGFPMKTMWEWYQKQEPRESQVLSETAPPETESRLRFLEEPTASVTGLMFQHGIATLGGDTTLQEALYRLGYTFGSLIYTLDAFEDMEQDIRKGEFNALQALYGLKSNSVPTPLYEEMIALLRSRQSAVENALTALPLAPAHRTEFLSRLRVNMNRRLGREESSTSCATKGTSAPQPLVERWRDANSTAHRLLQKHLVPSPNLLRRIFAPLTYAKVVGIALLFPQQAKRAESVSEVQDIAFNLIALGSALNALKPHTLMPAFAGGTPTAKLMQRGRRNSSSSDPQVTVVRRQRRSGGGCCDGCCEVCACDCCTQIACCEIEACCSGMECGGCCCEACACCGAS